MDETEKEAMDPILIIRLEKMITDGIVSNRQITDILNSLERKGSRRQKKENKKNGATVSDATQKDVPAVIGISYAQSEKVWGTWREKEKSLPISAPIGENKIFVNPLFGFQRYYLRGMSLAEMAKRFPSHNWGKYGNEKKVGVAGGYLISLNNPIVNMTPVAEKALHPKDCYRLDLNLTVELLITLSRLGVKVPEMFYRTAEINGHHDEVCVGLVDGRITFISEDRVRAQNKMALCLAKFEAWV